MKHFVFLVISVLLSVMNASATNSYEHNPDEYLYYDVNSGQPFVYDKTFENFRGSAVFDCPFAQNIVAGGNHVAFSISSEDFKWFIIRKATENYIDFEISMYDGLHLGWPDGGPCLPVISYVYIIRVEFDK